MGVYYRGLGAAFTTQMKIWSIAREEFCPAEARHFVELLGASIAY